jgi:hypothetical protein
MKAAEEQGHTYCSEMNERGNKTDGGNGYHLARAKALALACVISVQFRDDAALSNLASPGGNG